jgi:hypothetical protein
MGTPSRKLGAKHFRRSPRLAKNNSMWFCLWESLSSGHFRDSLQPGRSLMFSAISQNNPRQPAAHRDSSTLTRRHIGASRTVHPAKSRVPSAAGHNTQVVDSTAHTNFRSRSPQLGVVDIGRMKCSRKQIEASCLNGAQNENGKVEPATPTKQKEIPPRSTRQSDSFCRAGCHPGAELANPVPLSEPPFKRPCYPETSGRGANPISSRPCNSEGLRKRR